MQLCGFQRRQLLHAALLVTSNAVRPSSCTTMKEIIVLVPLSQLLNISKQLSCRLLVLTVSEGYGGPSQNRLLREILGE